ncbi:hypothetical protein EAb13_CDS0022 [Acinetobacter phage EAb13]|nr:hypothetical protein EAb13_CDS0022 [Acinetobacter phage EAb13]
MTLSCDTPDSYFQGNDTGINREQLEFALIFWRFNPKVRDIPFDDMCVILTEHWRDYTSSEFYRTPDSSTYECCYDYIANYCNNIL